MSGFGGGVDMKYIYAVLNWLFGVCFLIGGILLLFSAPISGLSFVIISFVLLPPVRQFAHSKTKSTLSVESRGVIIIILMVVAGAFVGDNFERKVEELATQKTKNESDELAKLIQKNKNFFNVNRNKIISSVKSSIAKKKYRTALSQSIKYLATGDTELKKLHDFAKTKQLLAKLKSVPSKKYELNKSLYERLLKLNPKNNSYKAKVEFYTRKIENDKRKELAAKERNKRIQGQFSTWDGSHRNLERFIKRAMNDPDSYKHVDTQYWDKGSYLIVKIVYRGKNAFGGIVKNFIKAKVSLDGQILQIIDKT